MTEATNCDNGDPEDTETRFSPKEDSVGAFSSDEVTSAPSTSNESTGERSEKTIKRVLSSYEIGTKLRNLRLKRKIALVDLGKHTGLSASMLSQLENGKLVPTLPTLARIAMVFDVGLEHFFNERRREKLFSIVRADERMKFPDRPGSEQPDFWFECLAFTAHDKSLQAYLAEFPKRGEEQIHEHRHDGSEFLHIVDGSISIRYANEEYVLNSGDSVYFDSSELHSYRGLADNPTRAIVVTTPPRL